MKKQKVVIEVWRGVVEVNECPDNVEIEIIDLDTNGCDYEDEE